MNSVLGRYYHTLRHLKFRQLVYQAYYRFQRSVHFSVGDAQWSSADGMGMVLSFAPLVQKPLIFDHGAFTFLNRTKSFGMEDGGVDWDFAEYGKLWTYNLNYFDFLLQPAMDRDIGLGLIRSFMAAAGKGSVGMEPYPVSLRGINWIKFLSLHQVRDDAIDCSLHAQYLLLLRNLEYHLLGNHLLENAFSLLFGAVFFSEGSWFKKSRRLLIAELDEQVLGDGAHFELSPMYHQILLDRLLDCVNLLQHNRVFDGQDCLLEFLRGKAIAMLGWLQAISFSDGSIPHVNDATDGIAPWSGELFAYAGRLDIGSGNVGLFLLKESGYRKHVGERYECIFDIGRIGPDYIPGHAHADTLGFVMQVQGRPFLVDTGTSTYEMGGLRDEERGTAAHNTVVVNGDNSSDVWGGFRVGRRAGVRILEDSGPVVEAQHDGYRRFGVLHRRRWEFLEDRILVVDRVIGDNVRAEARFHFDHRLEPVVDGDVVLIEDVSLSFAGAVKIERVRYRQALGFNRTIAAWCVVVRFDRELETVVSIR